MRILTCSLVASMAISMVSASELADAFKDGKVNGTIQAYNFTTDRPGGTDTSITTLGLDLSYETARLNGFGAKFTFQGASSPWADADDKAAHGGDMYGSGAQLSEAYISYVTGNTTAKIGRMYFWTPVLGGSGSRVTKEAFQGVSVTNTDIPDTTVTLAYMNKMQSRTDGAGDIGNFTTTFTGWNTAALKDGAYTIAITNKSIENLTITAAYADAIDVYESAYLEAAYKLGTYGVAAQYYYSDVDAQADDANLFGIKADATFGPVNVLAAYTTTSDDVYVIPGVGNGADMAYTWSEVYSDQYRPNQDAYKFAATYNINSNANIGASYVNEDNNAANQTYAYTAIKGSYTFTGALKGLNLWAAYEMADEDADGSQLRFKANYSF